MCTRKKDERFVHLANSFSRVVFDTYPQFAVKPPLRLGVRFFKLLLQAIGSVKKFGVSVSMAPFFVSIAY